MRNAQCKTQAWNFANAGRILQCRLTCQRGCPLSWWAQAWQRCSLPAPPSLPWQGWTPLHQKMTALRKANPFQRLVICCIREAPEAGIASRASSQGSEVGCLCCRHMIHHTDQYSRHNILTYCSIHQMLRDSESRRWCHCQHPTPAIVEKDCSDLENPSNTHLYLSFNKSPMLLLLHATDAEGTSHSAQC